MTTSPHEPTNTEALAFSVVLRQLETVQEDVHEVKQAQQQQVALLTKVVGLLEEQRKQGEVPVAPWETVYPEIQEQPPLVELPPVREHIRRVGFWRWFAAHFNDSP